MVVARRLAVSRAKVERGPLGARVIDVECAPGRVEMGGGPRVAVGKGVVGTLSAPERLEALIAEPRLTEADGPAHDAAELVQRDDATAVGVGFLEDLCRRRDSSRTQSEQ